MLRSQCIHRQEVNRTYGKNADNTEIIRSELRSVSDVGDDPIGTRLINEYEIGTNNLAQLSSPGTLSIQEGSELYVLPTKESRENNKQWFVTDFLKKYEPPVSSH